MPTLRFRLAALSIALLAAAAVAVLNAATPVGAQRSSADDAAALARAALLDAEAAIRAADARAHVFQLASERMAGRRSGRPGGDLASDYVAAVFESLGLEPAGDDGTFLHRFSFADGLAIGPGSRFALTVGGAPVETPRDAAWRPMAISTRSGADAEVVFAGYGLEFGGSGSAAPFDSFGDADLSGRWVLVYRGAPSALGADRRSELLDAAAIVRKAEAAFARGAVGVLLGHDPEHATIGFGDGGPPPLSLLRGAQGAAGPVIAIDAATTDALLSGAVDAAARARAGEERVVAGLDARLDAAVDLVAPESTGYNVLARLDLDGPTDRAPVIIGAHLDHLGLGDSGFSLGGPDEIGRIHFGADDNASGVAAMIEIAAYLIAERDAGRLRGARDIVFAGWAAEELGLIGSRRFVEDLAAEAGRTGVDGLVHSYLNMDMVGRLRDVLLIEGVGSSTAWPDLVTAANADLGLPIRLEPNPFVPTDSVAFYRAGAPTLAAFTGEHPDVHRPSDTAERLNYEGLAEVARLMSAIAVALAQSEEPIGYVELQEPRRGGGPSSVYLGVSPSYGADVAGVALSGVAPDGPAAEAGLAAGDVIVELAGREISDIYALMGVLDGLSAGVAQSIVVDRDGARVELDITPAARE